MWTTGSSAASYQRDARLRLTVERSFEIIDEALVRIERADPNTVARITDYRQIIGFRNVLAHQYDDTDDQQVWQIVQEQLPRLRVVVEQLLTEAEEPFDMRE